MLDLAYELKQLCYRNKDGSHVTQAQRRMRLMQAARDLERLGFKNMRARSLKPKHVHALVADWRERGLSAGTIKNRMADLRWWAEKIGKAGVVEPSNDVYGLARRVYVTNEQRALTLEPEQLAAVSDRHLQMSLRLQAAFGLRREESMKIRPAWADRGDHLVLKASWCKGGRPRTVPTRTLEQRALLDEARRLAGGGSLIPRDRSYVQQRRLYERQTERAGLSRVHGLRHAYAQVRYRELAGFDPPAAGGPHSRQLTDTQRDADQHARQIVSRELGHEREQITAVYLGR
jgi:site-specific recombinase XerC